MTAFSNKSFPKVPVVMDEADQAFQIALSEIGRASEDAGVRDLLKVLIEGAMERGGGDPVALAHAAIDEVVLCTAGRVRPFLSS